jgi:predicted DNA binding CopG/RHH family protein
MKQPKLSDLKIDGKGTRQIREHAEKVKKVKITINVDQDSLEALRSISSKTGAPYQKILNQILKDGLQNRTAAESRLDRLEKEVERLKKKIA